MKLLAAVSLIQMMNRYLSEFLTYFYGVSCYFSKILTEVALEQKICKFFFYWNLRRNYWKCLVTSFRNDDRTCRPTLLKTVSTIDILIDQVHKFQNSYLKGHPWKAATVLQKVYCLKVQSSKLYNNKYMIASIQITNTEIFVFIAVLVFKLLSDEVLFINKDDIRNC